jgi:hypothetical protein
MQLISHQSHLDALSPCPITSHIAARFQQLSEDSDVPPCIVWIDPLDDPRNSEFCFIGSNGLLSDLYDEHSPGEEGFTSPFEWVSRLPDLKIWEVLYLEFDMGTWLIIPDEAAESNPELLLALTAQELSAPQPL